MARTPSKEQQAAIEAIIDAVRGGKNPEVMRPRYSHVPDRTWRRWVSVAREQLKGEKLPKAKPTVQAIAKVKPKPKAKTKGKAATPPPIEGEHIPGAEAEGSAGINDPEESDPDLRLVMGVMGPREATITRDFLDGGARWQNVGALERLDSIFVAAMAIHDSSRKRVGHKGHVYIDPAAATAALELARKATDGMVKVLEKVHNAESAKQVAQTVLNALRKRDPRLAELVSADLRRSLMDLSSTAYAATE